jgi:Apoptosis inhibitory protein 5 (API5)
LLHLVDVRSLIHLYLWQDVTADEFRLCMAILNQTKLGRTVTGQGELVTLAIEQADMDADLGTLAAEDETVERFIQCSTEAIPFFSVRTFVYLEIWSILDRILLLVSSGIDAICQIHVRQVAADQSVEPHWCRRR